MRVVGVALLSALALGSALPAQEPTKSDLVTAVERQLKAANEVAGPCVACVVVSRSDRYPKGGTADPPGKLGGYDIKEFLKLNPAPRDARLGLSLDLANPENIPDHGYACGVVIDSSGLVLTPYHVVEGATKVYVYLPGRAGSYADIHAADTRHDLAVLKLLTPPPKLPVIKFADVRVDDLNNGQKANVTDGKLVVVMANTYALGTRPDRPTATLESLSKVRYPVVSARTAPQYYYQYGPLLERAGVLSAGAAHAGVSGAALLNLDGELIGLTTTSADIAGGAPGLAFPADVHFRRVVETLRRGEEVEYGYLGVLSPIGARGGVTFEQVLSYGPAGRAGIDERDVLTHVDGLPTTNYAQLLHRIGSSLAGSKVKLRLWRAGQEHFVEVTLGKFQQSQPFIASARPEPVFGLRVEYGSILAQQLQNQVRGGNGLPAGVCVRDLAPNSAALAGFKKLGDRPERWLITHVNGTPVGTPAEFYKAAKGQTAIKLTVTDPTELNPRAHEVSFP